ncbi:MAG TPA: MerR family transcriptional regulator [Acidobacteriota bacterium]|nr:MerR family transcriptional regulator [Acidobacteriota bacterium]
MTPTTTGSVAEGFSGKRTAEIVGITYRQLDYWARTDLVRPSLVDAAGSGSRRRYSYRDLLELKIIKKLLDAGIRLETDTGGIVGEKPAWVDQGERMTVAQTKRLYPGLYVSGMAANNTSGGFRMGPIFGGMFHSGEKVAQLILTDLEAGD